MAPRFSSVDEYIASCDATVQPVLEEIRAVVRSAVPESGEKIAYSIPTATLNGRNLLSYAAWTSHIGVYPIPEGDAAFQAAIEPYRDARSTARFPLSDPIPVELIGTMARLLAARADS